MEYAPDTAGWLKDQIRPVGWIGELPNIYREGYFCFVILLGEYNS